MYRRRYQSRRSRKTKLHEKKNRKMRSVEHEYLFHCRNSVEKLLSHAKFHSNRAIDCWVMANIRFSTRRVSAILNLKKNHIWSRDCHRVLDVLLCIKFYQNRDDFFVDIWRFNDLQYGGRPPSWICEFQSLCHVTSVAMLFCFTVQDFVVITQSTAAIWLFPVWKENKRPPYWNSTSSFEFDQMTILDKSVCIRLPNFVQISPSLAEIMTLYRF